MTTISANLSAQQTLGQMNKSVRYIISLPEGYQTDTAKRWPLMVFLHGSGETGLNIDVVKKNGPPMLVEQGKKFPFIIVSPQNEIYNWQEDYVADLVLDIQKQYRVDKDKTYLTGLSMGGFGTWAAGIKYAQLFAAIAPVCGGGSTSEIWKLRHVPVWCFHGAKDPVVSPSESEKMVTALKEFSGDVKFTLYPDADHNSWTATYNDPELYEWLLKQKRFTYTKVTLKPKALKTFEGNYKYKNGTSIKIEVEGDKLNLVTSDNKKIELSPISDHSFIYERWGITEYFFEMGKKGNVKKLIIYGREKEKLEKQK